MGQSRNLRRNKNMRRPKKGHAERRRRLKNQVKRLKALGVTDEKIRKMNPQQVRRMLLRPKKVKA